MIDVVDPETRRLPLSVCWSVWIALSAGLWIALAGVAAIVSG